MALSNETSAWLEGLKKEGGIGDEVYIQLKSSLEGKADEYVKGSQLRQADYSRVMSDVQKAQKAVDDSVKALADKESAVTKYQGELATWKQGADTNFQKAIQEREAANNKANAALARLKSIAVANGLDENEVLRDIDTVVTPPKKDDVANFDTSKFLTREDAAKVMAESALIDASIHDLAIKHQELTGAPLRGAAVLVKEALDARMSLSDYLSKKFDYPTLEAKVTEAGIQKRVDEAVAAERTKILSDASIPGSINGGLRTDLKGSPILGANLSKIPPVDQAPGGGISGAVAAFNAGKFAQNR
jgi:hypothetical protein